MSTNGLGRVGGNMKQSMRSAALNYVDLGWAVFPVRPGGKHPITQHGWKDCVRSPEKVLELWDKYPQANIGLACGPSGILVLDFDVEKDGFQGRPLLDRCLDLKTAMVMTGGGGWHIYFRNTGGFTNARGALPPGVDVRGDGGYVLLPPSLHPSGRRYFWVNRPEDGIMDVPDLLVALLRPRSEKVAIRVPPDAVDGDVVGRLLDKAIRDTGPGRRNEVGFWLACQLRDNGVDMAEAEPIMRVYQESVETLGGERYTWREAMNSLKQAYRRPPREPLSARRVRWAR